MNIILTEDAIFREQLKPLTLTRPIGMLRIGILTIKEKWEQRLQSTVSFFTDGYLQKKFPVIREELNVYINSSFLPTPELVKLIKNLQKNEAIVSGLEVVAYMAEKILSSEELNALPVIHELEAADAITLKALPDTFLINAAQIKADFDLITENRTSAPLTDKYTTVYGENQLFIEDGVSIKAAIINAESGPVYIGKNAIIQEGALIIGPAAIGEGSMVAFGAKIRPNTTLGPVCRVGGEVGNSIFHAYSNKAHDGFLGNSYIGEWCNLGANTNNSNLKNDYTAVKLYNYHTKSIDSTGELFCGTFMGDYTKAGISTMFNTGTVVGVSCNVFGAGFQEKFIPSFSWGGPPDGYQEYRFEKAVQVINATLARREQSLTEIDLDILKMIIELKPSEI